MNSRNYSFQFAVAALLFVGIISTSVAHAEATLTTKNEEVATLQKTYSMLKWADRDYDGHRVKAMRAVESACSELGVMAESKHHGKKAQIASDEAMAQAEGELKTVKDAAKSAGQDRLLEHVNHALEEIHAALKTK
jgi:hypothetical protein